MIGIRFEEGEYRPYFMCDKCGGYITKQEPGVMCWPMDLDDTDKSKPNAVGMGYVAHKGECHRSYELEFRSEGDVPGWSELSEATEHLKLNSSS